MRSSPRSAMSPTLALARRPVCRQVPTFEIRDHGSDARDLLIRSSPLGVERAVCLAEDSPALMAAPRSTATSHFLGHPVFHANGAEVIMHECSSGAATRRDNLTFCKEATPPSETPEGTRRRRDLRALQVEIDAARACAVRPGAIFAAIDQKPPAGHGTGEVVRPAGTA